MKDRHIAFELPIRIISELNNTDHWRTKHKRKKLIKSEIINAMCSLKLPTIEDSTKILLTRIAPRALDEDNLIGAMKTVRDSVASMLLPGLAAGRADGAKHIAWHYDQKKDKPKQYGLRVEINW